MKGIFTHGISERELWDISNPSVRGGKAKLLVSVSTACLVDVCVSTACLVGWLVDVALSEQRNESDGGSRGQRAEGKRDPKRNSWRPKDEGWTD